MGGGQQTQATQQTQTQLPAWVNDAAQSNYQMAQGIANTPLQQYQGPTVADPSAMTTQGYGMLQKDVGSTDPYFTQAADLYGQSAAPLDITQYLNPFTSEVENRAIANANTALTQQLTSISDTARQANAFGGSRAAVQAGVAQAQGVKNIGDLTAQLRQQGFDTATTTAVGQQANQRAAAQGLLSTAAGKQTADMTDISGLLSAGQQDTQQRQSVIDAAVAKFNEARADPTNKLNLLLASLGMTPYGTTQTGTKTTDTTTDPDWATLLLGAAKAAPALYAMSDRGTKTDIKKLTDGDIPIYAYRYKGDPKSYPKVVGPMAQDIEKKYPSAVKKVGRYKTVDINNLMEVLS